MTKSNKNLKKPSKLKNVKKLFSTGTPTGSLFWNSENKEMHYIDESDAMFRGEYMRPLVEMMGFTYEFVHDLDKIPDYVQEELECYEDDEDE